MQIHEPRRDRVAIGVYFLVPVSVDLSDCGNAIAIDRDVPHIGFGTRAVNN
jgi:hypothetical protein